MGAIPLAEANITALELETSFVSTAVAVSFGIAVVSVSASIASAVATSVAASSAAAGAGAVAGTAGSAARRARRGAGGGVTDVAAVLLAVQRLSVLSSMPVGKSELHASVGEALAWTQGSLGISSWISKTWGRANLTWDIKDPIERDERLEVETREEPGRMEVAERDNTKEEWVDAFDRLADTFTTLGCALAAVLLLQLLVHLLWKHCINRKYYALRKQETQKASPCLDRI